MKIYVVTYLTGGYAREDSPNASVACAVRLKHVADLVKLCVQGTVHELDLDAVPPGFKNQLKAYGLELPDGDKAA